MATLTEMLNTYNTLAQAAGKPTRKSFDNKAKAEAAIASLQTADPVVGTLIETTETTVNTTVKTTVETSTETAVNHVAPHVPEIEVQSVEVQTEGHVASESTETAPASIRVRKAAAIRTHGPRGFKVNSHAWMKSILARKGIALVPANFPKLLDTAAAHNVEVTEDMNASEIVASIASTLTV